MGSSRKNSAKWSARTTGEKHGLEGGLPRLAIEIKNRYFVFYTGVGEAEADYQDLFCELHGYGVETHDDLVMSLWLADLGVYGLIAKDRRKTERQDRRQQRRREKRVRYEIDGPVERREPKMERMEDAVSEVAQAEARRILAEALDRAGVGERVLHFINHRFSQGV